MKYLLSNQESLDKTKQDFLRDVGGVDAVHKLERMSMAELTTAYDSLLKLLKQREELIKMRLGQVLEHNGKEERVLFESGDYTRE